MRVSQEVAVRITMKYHQDICVCRIIYKDVTRLAEEMHCDNKQFIYREINSANLTEIPDGVQVNVSCAEKCSFFSIINVNNTEHYSLQQLLSFTFEDL